MHIGSIILAGGLATRMGGGQKALLNLSGRSLVSRVVARIAPQVELSAISANTDAERYAIFDLPVLKDVVEDYPGPLAGVLTGMRWGQKQGLTHVVSVAGDTPFFPDDLVHAFRDAMIGDKDIVMAATSDPKRGILKQPTFALWPVDLADDLESALAEGIRKIVIWAERHGVTPALFDASPYDPFFNVNSPDDMREAEKIVAEFNL